MRARWIRLGVLCLLLACVREDAAPRDPAGAPELGATSARSLAGSPPRRASTLPEVVAGCPDPPPDRNAALADYRSGAFEKLDVALDQRLASHLANPRCEPHFAELALWIEQAGDAGILERWIAERPRSWAAYSLRARHRLDRPNADLAAVEADLRRAIELEPRSLVPYYYYVVLLEKSARLAEVLPLLDRLLASDPFDFVVRERAIQALWPRADGRADAVREIAENAAVHAAEHPRLLHLLGLAAAARGDLALWQGRRDDAIASYREAIGYDDHTGWYHALADALYARGDVQGVVEVADRWLAWAPDDPHALMWRGMAGVRIDRARANRDIDRAVELDPDCSWVLAMRGFMRAVSDREAAATDLRRALELNPDEFAAVPPLARISFRDRPDEAEPLLRRWYAARPQDPEAWFYLGAFLLPRGDEQGRVLLERFLQAWGSQPQDWIVHNVALARRMLAEPLPAPEAAPGGA